MIEVEKEDDEYKIRALNPILDVKTDTIYKETDVFETKTPIYKIDTEKLENVKAKKNSIKLFSADIQKRMKQKVIYCTASEWEDSYKAILYEITGQTTIEGLK